MSKHTIKQKAQALLTLAHKLAETPGRNWVDTNNAIYGPSGPFVRLFPTKTDRTAFAKTQESRKTDAAIDSLPEPPARPEPKEYSGKLRVPVPTSLHGK